MKLHKPTKIVFGILTLMIVIVALVIAVNYKKLKDNQNAPADVNQNASEISVTSPLANSVVASPLSLAGKAKGNWFFEGSFPIQLLDEDGSVLGSGTVTAKGNWQTSGDVEFFGMLNFQPPKGQKGTLVFRNNNPSGLPQNQKQFRINVKFNKQASLNPPGTCSPDSAACKGNAELCMETNKNQACN